MSENSNNRQIRRHSSRKPRAQLSSSFFQPRTSISSPNSPNIEREVNSDRPHGRQLWNRAIHGVLQSDKLKPPTAAMGTSTVVDEPMGWYNLTKRVMQMNATPMLATAMDPLLHRENWQQRRYNFLSKHSMFGGQLKDELVEQSDRNEQGTDAEQRVITTAAHLTTTSSLEPEGSNIKRDSILGMAMTGVRNLLAETDEEGNNTASPPTVTSKLLVSTMKNASTTVDSVVIDEHDGKERLFIDGQYTQPENDHHTTTVVTSLSNTNLERSHTSHKSHRIRSIFSCSRRSSTQHQKKLAEIHESYRSHRPYFTYWVTFVQILVCVVSLFVYGYAPLSSTQSNNASIFEQPRHDLTMNPWFGPYPADLIRLGAKYTPCMRKHDDVQSRYDKQARLEAISGCCIDLATGRCMQTLSQQCLKRSGLTWYKTSLKSANLKDHSNFVYPAVCGMTPETCTKKLVGNVRRLDDDSWPSTTVDSTIFKWSPNPVQWPICLEQNYSRISNNMSLYPHMQCSNIARPCCTGVLGDCMLTSKEDCLRRRGIFHPRAHLCSQIDCIQSVCGMLEFFVARLPDQVYRFWTVIFIHAGLIHLLITIIFQYTIMRPLEKLAGCIRVMIIYIVSGFVGSIASALFLRDSIQVGPSGGQFAILACYLSELFLGWRSLKRPWIPFFKIAICLCLLFVVGLLPLVDNYSQFFGFVIGFMLNMIVFPDVNYKKNIRHLVVVTASLTITIALFIVLITLFYTVPFSCASCKLFSCPFGRICGDEQR